MLPYRSFPCYEKEIYDISTKRYVTSAVGHGWGLLLGIIGGGVPHGKYQILTLFQTKKCHFLHPFSDLAFKKLFHRYLV